MKFRARILFVLIACSLLSLMNASKAISGVGTTVQVSAEMGTNIADGLFPVTVKLDKANLFLTDPVVLFIDDMRIGIQTRVQAYDHRPEEGIAISENGMALLSGRLAYDPGTRQILLHDPKIDKFVFDRDSEVNQRFFAELNTAWSAQVTNPIRSEIPPHPYVTPFKDYIQDISYDGKSISLVILYQ